MGHPSGINYTLRTRGPVYCSWHWISYQIRTCNCARHSREARGRHMAPGLCSVAHISVPELEYRQHSEQHNSRINATFLKTLMGQSPLLQAKHRGGEPEELHHVKSNRGPHSVLISGTEHFISEKHSMCNKLVYDGHPGGCKNGLAVGASAQAPNDEPAHKGS